MVAAMGGLLFGYDWVVIGGAKPFFERFFDLSSERLSGWANSCALLGCLLGSLISGGMSDKFGRKKLLLLSRIRVHPAARGRNQGQDAGANRA
jgi:SP family xylose:H+ symportor-like MFS transporter